MVRRGRRTIGMGNSDAATTVDCVGRGEKYGVGPDSGQRSLGLVVEAIVLYGVDLELSNVNALAAFAASNVLYW